MATGAIGRIIKLVLGNSTDTTAIDDLEIPVSVSADVHVDIDESSLATGAQFPATIGQKARAGSLSTTLSTEDAAKVPALGRAAAVASVPTVLSTEDAAKVPALGSAAAAASIPVVYCTEDAAKIPASLGSKTDAASFPVTQSTEDKAVLAAMSAKLPASLGSKADTASIAVTQSTEDKAVLAALSAKLPAAAALADAAATPTTTKIGAANLSYNGATWDFVRSGLVAVQTVFTGLSNAISMLRYNAIPPTFADGNVGPLQGDANGLLKNREGYAPVAEDNTNGVIACAEKPLAVSTYCYTGVQSTALAASLILKNAAGVLGWFGVYNDAASAQYIQLHNAATLPADTAVPVIVVQVATKATWIMPAELRKYFSTGIVACNSSTAATKTIGSADCWFWGGVV